MTMHHSYSTKIGLILESRPMKIFILEHFSQTSQVPCAATGLEPPDEVGGVGRGPPRLSNTPHKVFCSNLKEHVWTEATQPLDLWNWDTFFLHRGRRSRRSRGKRRRQFGGNEKVRWHVRGGGVPESAATRQKHETVAIQMIVFGTAKDIAPIYSTSLHNITSLHPKAGTGLRLAPR